MFKSVKILPVLLAAASTFWGVQTFGQVKRNRTPVNRESVVAPAPTPSTGIAPQAQERGKKNERPATGPAPTKTNIGSEVSPRRPVYLFEFSHPYYLVRKLQIEHDETGNGSITFIKSGYAEPVSDPLEISPDTMERLRRAFASLNFLDSTEEYQSVRDHTHLGTMKITMRKDGRQRESQFNWTENKDAKAISEEYRKLGNQYIWMFEINLARENQPLQAPGLVDELDSLVRRNELSDPQQMLPFIQKLTTDERVPLIARNHALKIIKAIEKQAVKERG